MLQIYKKFMELPNGLTLFNIFETRRGFEPLCVAAIGFAVRANGPTLAPRQIIKPNTYFTINVRLLRI